MLNPFPVQFLTPLTFLLLRVVLGVIFILAGYRMLISEQGNAFQKVFGVLLMGTGTLFTLGLYTQIAAIVGAILTVSGLVWPHIFEKTSRMSLLFMFIISISLFITGAGPFAFDLPI